MNRRKEVIHAKHRERASRLNRQAEENEVASMRLKRPTVMLGDGGQTDSAIVERELPSLPRFWCHECHKDVKGTAYQFAGDLACESCVTKYYRLKNQSLSDVVPKAELERHIAEELAVELPWRAREGYRILREREQHKRKRAF